MTSSENRSPLSTAELERRWAAIRAAMKAKEIDALVMQNTSDWVGGYGRWFTDIPAINGYPRTVIFYADGPISVVEMGEFGAVKNLNGTDAIHRGVGTIYCTPSFVSINYTHTYEAELLVKDLKARGAINVGLITPGALPHAITSALVQGGESAFDFSDQTDLVDKIKAAKSAEEIALLHATARLRDQVFQKVIENIAPGMTDNDVANIAEAEAHRLGSDQGIFLCSSAAMGTAARFKPRQLQGRKLAKGEHFSLLIEVNGSGGLYTEMARTIVLGKASQELRDHFDNVRAAQDHSLSLIRPGVRAADIALAHDEWMVAHGLPKEIRLYAHGQGCDMVERPLIRHDETMELAENMCLAVHPGYDDGSVFAVICDNYMVEKSGPGACMHQTPKQIFEIV